MKKSLLRIALVLAMQMTISGCYESEIGLDWGAADGTIYDSVYSVPKDPSYHPAFFIDSVSQLGKSAVTIWAHILYDTILVVNARTAYAGYLEQPRGEGYRIVQSRPDTIDFRQLADTTSERSGRKERIYKYTVDFDSLRSGPTYWFCTINDYTEFTTGWPIWQSEYKCSEHFKLK